MRGIVCYTDESGQTQEFDFDSWQQGQKFICADLGLRYVRSEPGAWLYAHESCAERTARLSLR